MSDLDMPTGGRLHRICIHKLKMWMDEGGFVLWIWQWVGLPLGWQFDLIIMIIIL